MENTPGDILEMDFYDEYDGDFSLNQKGKMGGGAGKKNQKNKSKGSGETIYNSKHIRISQLKKENSEKKTTYKNQENKMGK